MSRKKLPPQRGEKKDKQVYKPLNITEKEQLGQEQKYNFPNYLELPHAIFDFWMKKLSVREFIVLIIIFKNRAYSERTSISILEIEKKTLFCKKSIKKYLNNLIDHALIAKKDKNFFYANLGL